MIKVYVVLDIDIDFTSGKINHKVMCVCKTEKEAEARIEYYQVESVEWRDMSHHTFIIKETDLI